MPASIISVNVSSETIHPSIDFLIEIQYRETLEIPIFLRGIVSSEDKRVLGHTIEIPEKNANQIPIQAFNYTEQINRTNRSLRKIFRLTLDQRTLDHIEYLREHNRKHDVVLHIECSISYLDGRLEIGSYSLERIPIQNQQGRREVELIRLATSQGDPAMMQTHLRMLIPSSGERSYLVFREEPLTLYTTIKSSDWINDFQPQLGIGRFLVMEIPEIISVNEPKGKLEERLHSASQNLLKIQVSVRKGEWEEVAEDCRAVYENLRSKDFREEFDSFVRKLLRDANGISDKGIGDFMQMIEGQNGFIHEFHHVIDKEGNPKTISVHKEDAYALYVSLVGLVNLLTTKYFRLKKLESK